MSPDFDILRNAYILTAVASVTFGVIGSFVVARRIGYLTGSIAHSAFGGVGVGLWFKQCVETGALGVMGIAALFTSTEKDALNLCEKWSGFIDPVLSALLFSILAALLVDWVRRNAQEREETILGAIWAIGAAAGLHFLEQV